VIALTSPVQMVGYLAAAVTMVAPAMRRDTGFKAVFAAGLVLWAAHYSMLGAWTAAGTSLVIASRQALSMFADRMGVGTRAGVTVAYCATFTGVLAYTWAGPASVLPWLAAINATYGFMWLQGVRMRAQLMLSTCFWLVNAILLGSIGHAITTIVSLAISVVTIHRLLQHKD
jgi:hypothetical protein